MSRQHLFVSLALAVLVPLVVSAQSTQRRAARQRVTRTSSGEVHVQLPDPTACRSDGECVIASATNLGSCCIGGGCTFVAVHVNTQRARDRVCTGFACPVVEQDACPPGGASATPPRASCQQRRCVLVSPTAVVPTAPATVFGDS